MGLRNNSHALLADDLGHELRSKANHAALRHRGAVERSHRRHLHTSAGVLSRAS